MNKTDVTLSLLMCLGGHIYPHNSDAQGNRHVYRICYYMLDALLSRLVLNEIVSLAINNDSWFVLAYQMEKVYFHY